MNLLFLDPHNFRAKYFFGRSYNLNTMSILAPSCLDILAPYEIKVRLIKTIMNGLKLLSMVGSMSFVVFFLLIIEIY